MAKARLLNANGLVASRPAAHPGHTSEVSCDRAFQHRPLCCAFGLEVVRSEGSCNPGQRSHSSLNPSQDHRRLRCPAPYGALGYGYPESSGWCSFLHLAPVRRVPDERGGPETDLLPPRECGMRKWPTSATAFNWLRMLEGEGDLEALPHAECASCREFGTAR